MPSIGKMAAQMTLDSTQFTAGLQSSGGELSKFATQSESVGRAGEAMGNSFAVASEKISISAKSVKRAIGSVSALSYVLNDLSGEGKGPAGALAGIAGGLALMGSGNMLLGLLIGLKSVHSLLTRNSDEAKELAQRSQHALDEAARFRIAALPPGEREDAEWRRAIAPILAERARRLAAIGDFDTPAARRAREAVMEETALPPRPSIRTPIERAGDFGIEQGRRLRAAQADTEFEAHLTELTRGLDDEAAALLRVNARQVEGQINTELLTKAITNQIISLQVGADAARRFELGLANVHGEAQDNIISLERQLGAMQDWTRFQESMTNQLRATMSPFERFTEDIDEYAYALETAAITEEQYNRLIGARVALLEQQTALQHQNVGALEAGSQAAFSAINAAQQNQFGRGQGDRLGAALDRDAERQEDMRRQGREQLNIIRDRLPRFEAAR